MIEDRELREMLAAEGHERLARMEEALLRLESDPTVAEAIDDLFRHAHSLKGAARMAELDALAERAHNLESRLSEVRAAKSLGKEDASVVLRGIDEMRVLLREATEEPAPAPVLATPAPVVAAAMPAPLDEGVRVDAATLDHMLDLLGELSGVRRRLEHRAEEAARLAREFVPASPLAERLAESAAEDHERILRASTRLEEAVQRVRLTALDDAIGPLRRVVRDVAAASGKDAAFEFVGVETRLDKRILAGVKDTLMHLVRNAVDHGIEAPADRVASGKPARGVVRIRARTDGSDVVLEVEDDGRGFDVEAVRAAVVRKGLASASQMAGASSESVLEFVFLPGFSTASRVTEVSGRGVGLDVVRDAARKLGGSYSLENRPGRGALIRLRFPAARSARRALLVRVAGRPFALPVDSVSAVERVVDVPAEQLVRVRPVPLGSVLGVESSREAGVLVALSTDAGEAGVLVESVDDEEDVVVKAHTPLVGRVTHVAGSAILDSGAVCIVLDAGDVVRSALRASPKPRVLVAEDSPMIRARVVKALGAAGFDVVAGQDGVEALALSASGAFAAVVSDVEMPRMDGLGLVARLRQDPRFASVPIVLFSSLAADADQERGRAAGADGYVVKAPDGEHAVVAEICRRVAASRVRASSVSAS